MPGTQTGKPLRLPTHMQMFFTAQVAYVDAGKGYKKYYKKWAKDKTNSREKMVYEKRVRWLAQTK